MWFQKAGGSQRVALTINMPLGYSNIVRIFFSQTMIIIILDCSSKSYQWLVDTVLPQFVKWGEEDISKNKFCSDSLALICTEKYYKKYNELKLKYGKEMVEVNIILFS